MNRPLTTALSLSAALSTSVLAGTSPSGFVTNPRAELASTRSLFIDNGFVITDSKAAELEDASWSGGRGASIHPDFWSIENGYYIDNFFENDALFYRSRGEVELNQLNDSQRLQGFVSNELLASATVTGPVEYEFTTTITFDRVMFHGEVDAMFHYSTRMTSFGSRPIIIQDSELIDLTTTPDTITFTATGLLNEDGGDTRVSFTNNSWLSLVIDAQDESAIAEYTMTTTAAFRAVPTPGTAMAFFLCAAFGITRCRT